MFLWMGCVIECCSDLCYVVNECLLNIDEVDWSFVFYLIIFVIFDQVVKQLGMICWNWCIVIEFIEVLWLCYFVFFVEFFGGMLVVFCQYFVIGCCLYDGVIGDL